MPAEAFPEGCGTLVSDCTPDYLLLVSQNEDEAIFLFKCELAKGPHDCPYLMHAISPSSDTHVTRVYHCLRVSLWWTAPCAWRCTSEGWRGMRPSFWTLSYFTFEHRSKFVSHPPLMAHAWGRDPSSLRYPAPRLFSVWNYAHSGVVGFTSSYLLTGGISVAFASHAYVPNRALPEYSSHLTLLMDLVPCAQAPHILSPTHSWAAIGSWEVHRIWDHTLSLFGPTRSHDECLALALLAR
ncbi:hypothetical protein VNO77_08567 [Canavalia gladiata]|uniref:Uncharacterized protein n=1 Tax=Canavalia gladiata TaxID=3824 RepID=A0AAN9M9B1_CANGL